MRTLDIAKRDWRPQGFGGRAARDIEDPLVEPLWNGLRLLAHVEARRAILVDRAGDEVDEPDVLEAVASAVAADSAVIDGYLTRDLAAMAAYAGGAEFDDVPTPASQTRQLFLGSRTNTREVWMARREEGTDTDVLAAETATFIAIDLLELLERKRLLESVVREAERVRIGIHVREPVGGWVATWRAHGFTSIAYKAANGRYAPGETNDTWAIAPLLKR
jgi:hypothetical protein